MALVSRVPRVLYMRIDTRPSRELLSPASGDRELFLLVSGYNSEGNLMALSSLIPAEEKEGGSSHTS